jgi:hypothetical protein
VTSLQETLQSLISGLTQENSRKEWLWMSAQTSYKGKLMDQLSHIKEGIFTSITMFQTDLEVVKDF